MKVKELRSWLEKFGDKNKQHYKRGTSHGRQLNPDTENLLTIQTKPSNASTSPSSSADSVSSEEDASISMTFSPSPTVVKDSSVQDEEKSGATDVGADRDLHYPDPSFIAWSDDSSVEDDDDLGEIQLLTECFNPEFKESDFETASKNSRRVTFGGIQGAESMSTHDQVPMNSNRTSLVHDAAGLKLSSHHRDVVNKEAKQTISNKQPQKSVFRQKSDPKFLEFLHPKQQTLLEPCAQKSVRPPRSSVGAAIDLFGGQGTRKSIVSRRTDELQRRWSESRAVTHVKKTKWFVCEKTGVFKRKIVVEPEHRSI